MRYCLVIVFIFSSAWGLQAQSFIGLKVGGHLTSINYNQKPGQGLYDMDQKIGYMGGVVFQQFTSKNFALHVEVAYVQKGWKTALDTLFNTQYERNIDYIDVPFLSHFSFGAEKTKMFFQLGFFVGYAISSDESLIDQNGTETREYIFESDRDNRLEYGLQGGVGFRREFGFGILQIEGNYLFTLRSAYKWSYETTDPNFLLYFDVPEEAQSQLIQVAFSYLYPIKSREKN